MAWSKARQKITEGVEYRDTVAVPFGGETVDLTHRLLNEGELFEIEASIDKSALQEHRESDASDAEQRLQELQQKDELTDDEERELKDLSRQVAAQQQGIMDSMGHETFEAFLDAGLKALVPSQQDIDDGFDLSVEEQERRFGTKPSTRDEMADAIETEMREMVVEQPYPIKLIIGQKAYAESLSLLGDVDGGNPSQ